MYPDYIVLDIWNHIEGAYWFIEWNRFWCQWRPRIHPYRTCTNFTPVPESNIGFYTKSTPVPESIQTYLRWWSQLVWSSCKTLFAWQRLVQSSNLGLCYQPTQKKRKKKRKRNSDSIQTTWFVFLICSGLLLWRAGEAQTLQRRLQKSQGHGHLCIFFIFNLTFFYLFIFG